jgi:hypothetical protein
MSIDFWRFLLYGSQLFFDVYLIAGLLFFGWPASVELASLVLEEAVCLAFFVPKAFAVMKAVGKGFPLSSFFTYLFILALHFLLACILLMFYALKTKDEFAYQIVNSLLGLVVRRGTELEWKNARILLENFCTSLVAQAAGFWWQYARKGARISSSMQELSDESGAIFYLSHFTVILGGAGLILIPYPKGLAVGIVAAKLLLELLFLPHRKPVKRAV